MTVYRELRRLRDRELVLHPEIAEARIVADEGNWAAYITAQGGPLVARDYLRVRLSYDIIENGNAYGDDVTTISGIYCPFMGESSLIHTRTTQYKIVPKRAAEDTPGFDFDVSGGSAAPRSSVNNCTRDTVADADVVEHAGQEVGETVNFGSLSRQEKKKLAQRLSSDVRHKQKKRPPEQEEGAELTVKEHQIRELLALRGIDASARMIKSIVAGAYIGHSDLIMVMVKGRLIAKHRSDSEFQELATQKMARIINRDRILSRLQLMLYKKDN